MLCLCCYTAPITVESQISNLSMDKLILKLFFQSNELKTKGPRVFGGRQQKQNFCLVPSGKQEFKILWHALKIQYLG